MKKHLPAIVLVGITLFNLSCHMGTSGTWKNDHIQPEIKSQIDVLNKQLFNDIKKKDVSGLMQLLSPILITNSGKQMDSLVNKVGATLSQSGYEVLDEYYTKNTTTNVPNTLISSSGDNSYVVNYLALNEEMYASIFKSTKTVNAVLFIAIYGKYGNAWKLNIIQMGEYQIVGKTAPDYYDDALKLYKSGDIIDAADMIIMASQIANPGGMYFKYKNESEMKNFYAKIVQEANSSYKFPLQLTR